MKMRLNLFFLIAAVALGKNSVPLSFEQTLFAETGSCQFVAHVRDGNVCAAGNRLILTFTRADKPQSYAVKFERANPRLVWEPMEPHGSTTYFGGAYQALPSHEARHYRKLVAHDVYPGIDIVIYGAEERLEYDVLIRPGADLRKIRLAAEGGKYLRSADGGLVLRAGPLSIVQRKPWAYQKDAAGALHAVPVEYRLTRSGLAEFTAEAFDRTKTLVIDPVIDTAGLFGGSGTDHVVGGDSARAVVGTTTSADFPGVVTALHRNQDVFVYVPATDSTVIIGGSGDDVVTSVAPPIFPGWPEAWLLIGGYTNSRDLVPSPQYPGANGSSVQVNYGGGASDGFYILLQYYRPTMISYFGGSGDDRVLAVANGGPGGASLTLGGSTTSVDLPLKRAWQTAPGGGLDGFVAAVDANGGTILSSYLGGSRDDRVLALAASNGSNGSLYVAGESRSNDWQIPSVWGGQRQGASDAFLIRTQLAKDAARADVSGLWIGGSAEDRATAMAVLPSGDVMVAGVTASSDFASPGQPYHGGDSDVFLAQYSADLQTTRLVRLLGGSGAEEPLGLAISPFNEVLVGGWTSSTDFPTVNAVQTDFGGGAADGFLYYLDSDANVLMSTYLGGPGTDRISSVNFDVTAKLYFSGETDATTLPFPAGVKGSASGTYRGFWGSLGIPVLHGVGLSVGKDLSASVTVRLGDSGNAIGLPLTVASADSGQVLLAAEPGDQGQGSVTIAHGAPANNSTWDPAVRNFRVECLSDAGSIPLTLSASGYPTRAITVRCVPSALVVTPTQLPGGGSFSVYPAAIDPAMQTVIAAQPPRSGTTIRVAAQSLDPALAKVSQPSILYDSDTQLSPYLPTFGVNTSGPGETDIVLSTDSSLPLTPIDRVHVTANVPGRNSLTFYTRDLAKDTLGTLWWNQSPAPGGQATLTISDPSKLLFWTAANRQVQSSVTVSCNNGCPYVWILVLDDSGPVSITSTSPGYDSYTAPVSIGQKTAGFVDSNGRLLQSVEIPVSGTVQAELRVYISVSPNQNYGTTLYLRPGMPDVGVLITGSDGSVARPASFSGGFRAVSLMTIPITITGVAPGTATFSPQFDGLNVPIQPLTVKVFSPAPQADPITLGKNLQTWVYPHVVSPANSQPQLRITSPDPSRVVVSADGQSLGQGSLTLPRGAVQFWVQAIADNGQVVLTLDNQGQKGQLAVTLAPSGMAWTTERLNLGQGSSTASAFIAAYALDPATLAPFAAQQPIPGSNSPSVVSSDPSVADAAPSPHFGEVLLAIKGSGAADISIVQPPGFSAPLARLPLHVTVARPSYAPSVGLLGRNLQATVGLYNGSAGVAVPPTLILSSGDPSKLLLSTSPADPPTPSVTVRRISSAYPPPYQTVYAHALDGPVDVKLTASGEGLQDASSVVSIQKSMVALLGYGGAPVSSIQAYSQSPLDLTVAAAVIGPYNPPTPLPLRSGLGPVSVEVRSSNPDVASVQTAPVYLNTGEFNATLRVTPKAPGDTMLTVVPPPGFAPPPKNSGGSAKLTVIGTTWALPNLPLSADLRASATLSIQNSSSLPTANVDVTLTSSDPSLVGLSVNPLDPPSGSIVVQFTVGQQPSRPVYVTGLGAAGSAQIRIAAPGYVDSTALVTLAPLALFSDYNLRLSLPVSPQTVQLRVAPAVPSPSPYVQYAMRPGAPDYTLAVSSSDSRVMSPVAAQVTLHGGDVSVAIPLALAGPGDAVLSVQGPAGFVPASIPISVQGGYLSLYGPGPVGAELQDVGTLSGLPPGTTVTVTSSDPSRVLISASPTTTGQASISLTQPSNQKFWVQALANTGTVTLTASAPGYQSATTSVPLVKSVAVFVAPYQLSLLTPQSPPLKLDVALRTLNGYSSPTLRPGAPSVTVQVNLTDRTVGSVTPPALVFNPGDSKQTVSFQPLAAGSTLLSLGIPPGFADPVAQGQQLLTVVPAKP